MHTSSPATSAALQEPGPGRSAPKFLRPFLVALAIAISGWVHLQAGFTFPVPWDDETIFVWQARAFSESLDFNSEHLHPDRAIFSQLPGYPAALGLFFKLVPPSLVSARWFSWLLTVAAYLLLLSLVRGLRNRALAEVLLSYYFLNGPWTIAGNVARAEPLVLVLVLAGFSLLMAGRLWNAAALLGLAVLVHPASFFFPVAAVAVFLARYRKQLAWPKPSDVPLLAFALAAGLATVFYFARHWALAAGDVQEPLGMLNPTWLQRLAQLATPPHAVAAALLTASVAVAWKKSPALFLLAVLAWTCWSVPIVRPQMWYSAYTACAYAIGTIVVIELVSGGFRPARRTAAACATAGLLLAGTYLQGHGTDPRHYPDYMWWNHMAIRKTPYVEPADVQAVAHIIAEKATPAGPTRVAFVPSGDGLLFMDALPEPFSLFYPLFTQAKPDLTVFHLSDLSHPAYRQQVLSRMAERGLDPRQPSYSNRAGDAWYVHVRK